jgi:CheY-like chemotaxis protein
MIPTDRPGGELQSFRTGFSLRSGARERPRWSVAAIRCVIGQPWDTTEEVEEVADALVLLVEDDPDLLDTAQFCLETAGLAVVTARNGKQALDLLHFVRPNVILLDMMMPVLDGFGFLRAYKERYPKNDAPPVLATSAFIPYLDNTQEYGVAATLPKPYDPGQLIQLIRQLTSEARHPEPSASPTAEYPPGEQRRLQAILDLRLNEPAPEAGLNSFVERVAHHFGMAIALVSVVTDDQQYWTAACGLPADLDASRSTPRRESFCTHAVAARAALVVQDTSENPFFQENALVRERGVRFYAGVPLVARHGEAVGTLCLLDFSPRTFRYTDLELLGVFGRCVLATIEQREKAEQHELPESVFRFLQYIDHELDTFGQSAFRELAIVEAARGMELGLPVACVVLAAPYRRLGEIAKALRAHGAQGLVGRLGHSRLGWIVMGMSAEDAYDAALAEAGPHAFAEADELQRYPGAALGALDALEMRLGDAGLA